MSLSQPLYITTSYIILMTKKMPTIEQLTQIAPSIKKLKKYAREALVPLYYKHAHEYLLRVIKTAMELGRDVLPFIARLETFRKVATCHEVAINEYLGFFLATHQNPLGWEREYTNHPIAKAKNIGRNLRVRIIWEFIIHELTVNPGLEGYEPIPELLKSEGAPNVYCPVCNMGLYDTHQEVIGYHDDGTPNTVWEGTFNPCEHYIGFADSDYDIETGFEVISIHRNISMIDILEEAGLIKTIDASEDPYESNTPWGRRYVFYTDADFDAFKKFKKLIKEELVKFFNKETDDEELIKEYVARVDEAIKEYGMFYDFTDLTADLCEIAEEFDNATW